MSLSTHWEPEVKTNFRDKLRFQTKKKGNERISKPDENKKKMISENILQVFILVGLPQRLLRKLELSKCSKTMN